MPTVYDVPASMFISTLSQELRKVVETPEFATYVKTGAHADRAPLQENWWTIRCASLLRRIYVEGPIGVQKLKTFYGGKKNRGVQVSHRKDASGKVIRLALQQLEKAELVSKDEKSKGRVVTKKGKSFLDKTATQLKKKLESVNPDLKKY